MQTSNEAGTERLTGFTQTPLLDAEQMVVGAIITGIVMSYVWTVTARESDTVEIERLPRPTANRCVTHDWEAYGRGYKCRHCQSRRMPVNEFTPKRENKPRAFILAPHGPIQTVRPGALYAGLIAEDDIQLVSAIEGGEQLAVMGQTPPPREITWERSLPIFPKLVEIWSLPLPLTELNEAGLQAEQIDD